MLQKAIFLLWGQIPSSVYNEKKFNHNHQLDQVKINVDIKTQRLKFLAK